MYIVCMWCRRLYVNKQIAKIERHTVSLIWKCLEKQTLLSKTCSTSLPND